MNNNLLKLGLAVLLAIAAGVMNMFYLASREKPTEYLALDGGEEVFKRKGDLFPADTAAYKAIKIPGDVTSNQRTLIPYKDLAIVFGMTMSRDFKGGDPIFFSDIADTIPHYETLGPFTLLSVGEHLTGTVETDRNTSNGAAITVEPIWEKEGDILKKDKNGDLVYGEPTRRLLQIIEAQRQNSDKAPSYLKIVAIEPRPTSRGGDGTEGKQSEHSSSADEPQELIRGKLRAIIVPIERVATIPKVMQIGAAIAFVVPAYP